MIHDSMSSDPMTEILERDPRYPRAAYELVGDALRRASGHRRHVSPVELLNSIRELACEQFGPLAGAVLEEWGVRSTRDFGNIVFNCIAVDAMGASDEDTIEDFDDVYDFADAFPLDTRDVVIAVVDPDAD
jgi:uncharacterized repeat protein (TIGR04138 family)